MHAHPSADFNDVVVTQIRVRSMTKQKEKQTISLGLFIQCHF